MMIGDQFEGHKQATEKGDMRDLAILNMFRQN